MWNRLIVLCVALIIVGLSISTLANPPRATNPLKIDIVYAPDNQQPQPGWLAWPFEKDWTSPVSQAFDIGGIPPEWPTAELSAYRKAIPPYPSITGGARNRSGGLAFVAGPGEYSTTGKGLGTSYLQLKLTNLLPNTEHIISLWSWERTAVWANPTDNPNSKWGFWGISLPVEWLNANGYSGLNGEPNGYYPKVGPLPITESNMPAELLATGSRIFIQSPDPPADDWYLGDNHCATLTVYSNASGEITLYGWNDSTDLRGAMHMPLNGFMVIPEPLTIALLGLGGLAMLRKRRA
jgi:hypothetical protein